jgi:hypothetical protein
VLAAIGAEGEHDFIRADWIETVDGRVHLNKNSTAVMALWKND